MFYLTKYTHEKDFAITDVVMLLADFSGIEAGLKGVVTDKYDEGVMITWMKDGKTKGEIIAALTAGLLSAGRGFLSDGFSRDELEYLAVETLKHPSKI